MAEQTLGHPERVRQLFDAKAGSWAAKYAPRGRLAGRLTRLADEARRHLSAGECVLDLGCGTGDLARHLATLGLHVTGCDISRNMLEQAAAADQDGAASWLQLDPRWTVLPFGPASFDAVIAASVLEYVDSPRAVLRECARVLRPGGVLVCTVPDLRHPIRWLEWTAAGATRVPPARAAGRRWPRLGRYLTYLRISRHRRPAHWWQAAATGAGLWPRPGQAARLAPLRMLTFRRPGTPGEAS